MILDRLFARNTRRKKDAVRGNYAFRSRRRRVRLEVHRLEMNPETPASIREKRRKVMRWGFKLAVASLVLTGIVSAGKIVVRVLKGENPGTIAIEGIRATELYVNPGAAEKAGIAIPAAIIAQAKQVVK